MKMFNPEIENQLTEVLQAMVNDVTIALFTKSGECPTCEETKSYMKEIEALSDKIHLQELDINSERAKEYQVEMVPSIVLLNHKNEYLGIKIPN